MIKKLLLVMFVSVLSDIALIENSIAQESAEAEQEESPFSVDVTAALFSDYIFRGQSYYSGTSFQPSIAPRLNLGDYGNISGLLFFHVSADDNADGSGKFFETDVGFTYDKTFGPATFSIGNAWYTYPGGDDQFNNSAELYAGISLDTVLTPTFNVYHYYTQYDSQYYELNLSHTFQSASEGGFNITPFIAMGWTTNGEKVYGENSAYAQTTYGFTTDIPAGAFTFQPIIAYTSGAAKVSVDEFWMGFSLVTTL